jgi:type I restriction enzyme S subunit
MIADDGRSSWTPEKLEDICAQVTDGKHGDCREQPGSGYYFLSCKDVADGKLNYEGARQITESDFIDTHRRTKLAPRDVLITNSGTIGRMAIAADNDLTRHTTFQKSVAILKPIPDRVESRFLYYALQSDIRRLIEFAGGTAQKNLLLRDLRAFEVRVPPLPMQRHIAGILSAYDELIDNSQRRIRILETMARSLYREWFVKFRFPGHGKVRWVPSALGEIPRGWEFKPLGKLANITMGLSPKGDTYNECGDGTPLVNGPVEFGEHFTKQIKWTSAPTKLCKAGALVVCVRGSTTGKYVKSDGVYCLGRGVCAIESEYQTFIDLLFAVELPTLLAQTGGSTFPSWTGPQLQTHPVLSPPNELLKEFEILVRPMSKLIAICSRKIDNLRQTRDLLLPRLLVGQKTSQTS